MKGVAYFCLNDNPVRSNPFSVEVCVALKKKTIQLYTITEDRILHTKDMSIPEPALAVVSKIYHVPVHVIRVFGQEKGFSEISVSHKK